MYKPIFNQRKALRFRQFTRKGYALFACLGRVVTIGVLSVATLESLIQFTPKTVYIRFVGTHKEYDAIKDIQNI